jgi:3D-(3,5/4)-trihydroxycyclohexane-1,2-dione acylhydrolase (decyclizing)
VKESRRPLIVAGGGVIYSEAADALDRLVTTTGIPVAVTQAGVGAYPDTMPACLGAIGATGTTAANTVAGMADLVIGIGTRWSDFTTASSSIFADPAVRFININIKPFDAAKMSGIAVTGDARAVLEELETALAGWSVPPDHRDRYLTARAEWDAVADGARTRRHLPLPSQAEVIATVNQTMGEDDVVIAAAGSLPGDLHKLWRATRPGTYHVEYAYSCMGYEIAAGVGAKLAAPEREIVVMVGDSSYLMLPGELVTALQFDVRITVVLVHNHGYASIGALSETVGVPHFGTERTAHGDPAAPRLRVDLAANAASLGAEVEPVSDLEGLRAAMLRARVASRATVIVIETDPTQPAPASHAWWDVPVAEVSAVAVTQEARRVYEAARTAQRHYLHPSAAPADRRPLRGQ